jgi:PAS domain S-box-containing protein
MAISILLAGGIFLIDSMIPLGIAGGVPYIALVLLSLWSPRRRDIIFAASLGSVLTIVGYFISPVGGIHWMVLSNRFLAILAIWVTAILAWRRKAIEDSLKLSAEIMENMAEGVNLVRISDGVIVFTNPTFDKIFGYGPSELIGRHVTILNAAGEKSPEETAAEIIRGAEGQEGWSGNVFNVRKDGTTFWTSASVSRFTHPQYGEVWVSVQQDISGRRCAQQALRQSEKRLRDILDGLFGFVGLFATDGILVEANHAPLEVAGLKKEDVIGKPCWETYWWSYSTEVQDQLRDALRCAANGETVRYDVPVRIADDQFIEIDVMFGPLFDADGEISQLLGFAVDVTERKQAEAALVESEGRLNLAVRGTSDGLWDRDIETGGVYWSPRFKELLGYREDEIEATADRFQELLHSQDKADVLEAVRLHLEENQPYDIEFRLRGKNGGYRWFQSRGEALRNENGRPYRMAGSIRDITERKRLIQELEAKNAELERFTYTVSHDLKSPLITICGFLGLLEKDTAAGDTERMREDFEEINAAAAKMELLLSDLLELSRIGRVIGGKEDVCLAELAREAVRVVAGQIEEQGVQVEISPELPRIFGDRGRLLEVIQNLIENAAKFMRDQPEPRVEIGVRQDGEDTVCYVRDNGIGIEPRYQEKIFGLFDRLNPKTEGTGVGLALVKRIVEVHGGRVWVESEGLGCGCTFCFCIPGKKD